jgi:NitT/TauT family transport system substrate-binding protein
MRITLTGFLLFVVLFVGFPIILSAEGAAEERREEKTPVTLHIGSLKGPTGIGMIRLFENKPQLGENVISNYELAGSPDILVSKLLSGEVDIASLPTNVAAKLYAKGAPYKLAAITGYGVLYLIGPRLEEEGPFEYSQLEGTTIYNVGKAATPEYIFSYILKQNGIDPQNDLTIRFQYPHPELAQLLIAERVRLGVLPEPFVTKVLMNNPDAAVLLDLQKEWAELKGSEESYPMSCVVVKKQIAEQHPDIVDTFLNAYRDSIRWVTENPEKAGKLSEKHGIGMDAKTAEAAIPRLNLHFKNARKAKTEVESFLQVLFDGDPAAIGDSLPDASFYLD